MMLFPVFLVLAAIASMWIVLVAFDRLRPRQRWLIFGVMTVSFFGFMMLIKSALGNAAAWNIFAFVFIGLGAWHRTQIRQRTLFREKKIWEGNSFQNPESEEFGDALKITTNNLTGVRNGVVLSGLFDERYLSDLNQGELAALADELSERDPRSAGLLADYMSWRRGGAA